MSRLQSEEFLLLLPPTSLFLCYKQAGLCLNSKHCVYYSLYTCITGGREFRRAPTTNVLNTSHLLSGKTGFSLGIILVFCFLKKLFLGGHHVSLSILLINLKKSEPGGKKIRNTRFDFTMSLSFPEPKLGTHWMKRICFSLLSSWKIRDDFESQWLLSIPLITSLILIKCKSLKGFF